MKRSTKALTIILVLVSMFSFYSLTQQRPVSATDVTVSAYGHQIVCKNAEVNCVANQIPPNQMTMTMMSKTTHTTSQAQG